MAKPPSVITKLINELVKLPGIGPKSAQKLAFNLISHKDTASALSLALTQATKNIIQCKICHLISENEICNICQDETRDKSQLCVIEDTINVFTIEDSGVFKGIYHALGGVISPIKGIGPEQLNIKSLLSRLETETIKEVIIATNPTPEGEASAYYIAKLIEQKPITVSRLAVGLPSGGYIEHADQITLDQAFKGRINIKN